MEIVYLYLHDYRRFKKQNINFGSEFIFNYDENSNLLTVENNNLFIKKFYNNKGCENILNISALIGENGSGKTGLLDYLVKIYADALLFNKEEPFMFVLKNNDEYTLHYLSDFFKEIDIFPNSFKIKKIGYRSGLKDFGNNSKLLSKHFLYLDLLNGDSPTSIMKNSNIFLGKSLPNFSNVFDFSTDGLISNYMSNEYFKETNQTNFYNLIQTENNQDYIQLFSFLNKRNNENLIPFKIPHLVKISSFDDHLNINKHEISRSYDECKSLIKQIHSFLDENKIIITDSIVKFNFISNILLNVPINMFNMIIDDLEKSGKLDLFYKLINITIDYLEEGVIIFKNITSNLKNKSHNQIDIDFNENILDLINWYVSFVKQIVLLLGKGENNLGLQQENTMNFIIEIIKVQNITTVDYVNTISKSSHLFFEFDEFMSSDLVKYYNLSAKYRPYINFEFDVPLSSGQYAYLNLFSRILKLFKTSTTDKKIEKHILLIIDEIDLYLHPNWQKNVVFYLGVFLNKLFPEKTFQIIFTSNNPLPISDLLAYNTVFLSNDIENNAVVVKDSLDEQKQTFASNIHTLLADSFFVKGGLIGDFSKDKINDIIKLLSENKKLTDEEHNYIKKLIKQIGEPLIKNKLFQMYSQKNGLDYLERLERVENILKRVEEKLDSND